MKSKLILIALFALILGSCSTDICANCGEVDCIYYSIEKRINKAKGIDLSEAVNIECHVRGLDSEAKEVLYSDMVGEIKHL